MAGQAFHGGGVEQIGGIVEGGPDAVFVFLNIQRQVELRSLAVPGQAFQTQVLQLNLGRHRAYLALMVEQHLEQWVVAGIALRLQGFHQLLERQVLVRLGLQRALPSTCPRRANNRSRLSAVKSGVTADSARGAIRPTRRAVPPGGATQPSTCPVGRITARGYPP